MLINAAPADEIAEIRGQIKMLRDREADLRQGFLTGQHGQVGAMHEVQIKTIRKRRLLRERLPAGILNDPAFWSEQVTQMVEVHERPLTRPDDDFDVFEPFD